MPVGDVIKRTSPAPSARIDYRSTMRLRADALRAENMDEIENLGDR